MGVIGINSGTIGHDEPAAFKSSRSVLNVSSNLSIQLSTVPHDPGENRFNSGLLGGLALLFNRAWCLLHVCRHYANTNALI